MAASAWSGSARASGGLQREAQHLLPLPDDTRIAYIYLLYGAKGTIVRPVTLNTLHLYQSIIQEIQW
jgi:hypothetical protein